MHRWRRVKALPDVLFWGCYVWEKNKLEKYQDTYVEIKLEREG